MYHKDTKQLQKTLRCELWGDSGVWMEERAQTLRNHGMPEEAAALYSEFSQGPELEHESNKWSEGLELLSLSHWCERSFLAWLPKHFHRRLAEPCQGVWKRRNHITAPEIKQWMTRALPTWAMNAAPQLLSTLQDRNNARWSNSSRWIRDGAIHPFIYACLMRIRPKKTLILHAFALEIINEHIHHRYGKLTDKISTREM